MKMSRWSVVALVSTVFVLLLALGGCAGSGSFATATVEETGAFKVTADNAGKGSAGGSIGGGLTIAEGQILLISPDLQKGSVQIRLLDASGKVAFDEEISGRALSTYTLDSGEYSIGATCNEDGTTGTLLVVPTDKDEFEKQSQDLDVALTEMGVSTDSVDSVDSADSDQSTK